MHPSSSDPAGGGHAGYLHAGYAESLSEWGTPRHLKAAGAWALERPVPGSDRVDAMGPYPLLACRDWSGLAADLDANPFAWVTFTAVPDPLGAPPEAELRRIFRDHVARYKAHYVVELDRWDGAADPGHRRRVRTAAARVETRVDTATTAALEDWVALYEDLVRRHCIRGMLAFSRRAFARLLEVPGFHVSQATERGQTVAMSLWVRHGPHAYYHLGASTARGYEVGASYAAMDAAIRHLADAGARRIDLGGAPGAQDDHSSGLARFKRGWTRDSTEAYICGRVLDAPSCRTLGQGSGAAWFPAYRAGERL